MSARGGGGTRAAAHARRRLSRSLRADAGRLAIGLLAVGAAVALNELYEALGSFPVAVLLIPVLGMALVAQAPATAVVGVAACVAGITEIASSGLDTPISRLRLAALVVGSCLGVALALVRTRREVALAAREVELGLAQRRSEANRLVATMLERVPELTQAPDIGAVARHACHIAREMFGSDSASYWQVDGDDCVLLAREPEGTLPLGTRMPESSFVVPAEPVAGTRTGIVRRKALADLRAVEPALRRTGTAIGSSTPVRIGGLPVAYLGLGWDDETTVPDSATLSALDRFTDQIAIAKTVVRRRIAQQEANELGRRLQAGLLPVSLPVEGPVTVRSEYRPGTRDLLLGGDFLDVVRNPDDDSISFLLGDVSGHGPEQAALGTMLRSAWTGVASLPSTTIKEWVSVLDYVVRERGPSEDLFVTAVMGRIDVRQRLLHYVLAGHPPPILLTPEVAALPTGDPPLGVLPEAVVTLHTVELPEQWSVLLVTDGLFEGRTSPGERERVGFDGFVDILRAHADESRTRDEWLRDVADDMEARNGGPMADDAAAILLLRR